MDSPRITKDGGRWMSLSLAVVQLSGHGWEEGRLNRGSGKESTNQREGERDGSAKSKVC